MEVCLFLRPHLKQSPALLLMQAFSSEDGFNVGEYYTQSKTKHNSYVFEKWHTGKLFLTLVSSIHLSWFLHPKVNVNCASRTIDIFDSHTDWHRYLFSFKWIVFIRDQGPWLGDNVGKHINSMKYHFSHSVRTVNLLHNF